MAIVINELLAFLQHASNAMEEDSILELCKSTFNKEEIVTAKQMLYEVLGKTARMTSRHTDSEEKSLQDIITLLKQSGPKEVPVFVARDLYKLPVMTMDHINVSSLLKNVSAVKAEQAFVPSF